MDRTYLDTLSLTDLIRLQDELSEYVRQRFARVLTLCFSDVVGSTAYFSRFGTEAGRSLLQRHLDVLRVVLDNHGGRIVDTAGDGAFFCLETADAAANAVIELQARLDHQNHARLREHHVVVRCGLHTGHVLVDGDIVTGDSVNVCARVAASAEPGEIRLTQDVFGKLSGSMRILCRTVGPVELKGLPTALPLFSLQRRAPKSIPTQVRIEETGVVLTLPPREKISFGRLAAGHRIPGNDIVLALPERGAMSQISRWHFELHRSTVGITLHPISEGHTEVDGTVVARGEHVPIHAGSLVRVANVVSLTFLAEDETAAPSADAERTIHVAPPRSE